MNIRQYVLTRVETKYILCVVCLFVVLVTPHAAQSEYHTVPLPSLHLNRTATRLTTLPPFAHVGFVWQKGDNETRDWRPQGIAGISGSAAGTRKFLVISWYHLKKSKGARLSFVDVTNMNAPIRYRHVLLVDKSNKPLVGLHAGGLVYKNGEIHVPDLRRLPDPRLQRRTVSASPRGAGPCRGRHLDLAGGTASSESDVYGTRCPELA